MLKRELEKKPCRTECQMTHWLRTLAMQTRGCEFESQTPTQKSLAWQGTSVTPTVGGMSWSQEDCQGLLTTRLVWGSVRDPVSRDNGESNS